VAEANNQGIELALQDSCDWVLLLNNDTVFTEDTIADLVAEAEHNNLSMVSPLIAATEPAATIWYSGGTVDPWRGMRVDHERKGASLDRFPRTLESTPYAPTCCLLIRPSVFGDIGLMDTIYFVYHDDVDFALRAGRAGHRIWVTPNAHLLHKASSLTGGELSDFSVTWSSRNWVLLARIHCTRLQLMYFSIHLHVWALARLLLRRDTVAIYLRRQRAFFDGWRVSLRDHVRYGIRSATRPVEQ
jgi:GT2 family glycosyltransferase